MFNGFNMLGNNNFSDNYTLMFGGIFSLFVKNYIGLNNDIMTNILTTGLGSMAISKMFNKFKEQFNFSNTNKLLDNNYLEYKKILGINYYSLKISNSSVKFTKILAYIMANYKDKLLSNNIDNYSVTNEELSNIKFSTDVFSENYQLGDKNHLIIILLNNLENVLYIQSKSLNVDELKKFVNYIVSKNTNSYYLNVYQPIITRYDDKDNQINTNKVKKYNDNNIKTIIEWNHSKTLTNKNLENTMLSSIVKKEFIEDLINFLNSENYYNSKGIPYKRGYLLNGPPGTGKTSLIKAIANSYGMDVYIINMSEIKTCDDITKIFRGLNNDDNYHIVCFEDIDRSDMFKNLKNLTLNTHNGYGYNHNNNDDKTKNNAGNKLRTLLNELDGIVEGNKRITIFTSNDSSIIEQIDALCRPGRIDKKIEITYCDAQQLSDIYNHFTCSGEKIFIDELNISITPANAVKIMLSNTNLKPNEFLNVVNGKDINYIQENNMENNNMENNNMENSKKRKLTNIEREIPKVFKLLNDEITRTNNINKLLNSCEDEFNEETRKKFKKVLLGNKINNKKINKHVQSINKKINKLTN
jgi:SpoVK/Ycf46/Vps4 family AAA+-type ATPase